MPVFSIVGGSQANASASGGKINVFNNISTIPQSVALSNPQRRQIIFHNPGAVDVYIGPSVVLNALGSNITFTPALGSLGGCFVVFANGGTLTITGECQIGWQALSASGTTNPLTVMDSNT